MVLVLENMSNNNSKVVKLTFYRPQQQQQQPGYQSMNKAPLNGYIPINNNNNQQPTYETPKYPYSRPPWGSYGVRNYLKYLKSNLILKR